MLHAKKEKVFKELLFYAFLALFLREKTGKYYKSGQSLFGADLDARTREIKSEATKFIGCM
jgi:hypothetical protein